MFRLIYPLLLICIFTNISFAQLEEQSKFADIDGVITDYDLKVKIGETIIFENIKTKEVIECVSNDKGEFKIQLPYSQKYLIKIKGISGDNNYTEFEIPALEENQTGLYFNIDIRFDTPKMYTLENVYFDTGKATLKKESTTELNELLEFMTLKKNTVIEIAGHTDNVGSPEDNMVLSQKRAESVMNFLITNGIASSRISAKGYGESTPISTNDTNEGRKSNRRTEVRIIKE